MEEPRTHEGHGYAGRKREDDREREVRASRETALQEIDPGPRCDGVSDRVENRVPAEENPGRDTGERRVGECVAEK